MKYAKARQIVTLRSGWFALLAAVGLAALAPAAFGGHRGGAKTVQGAEERGRETAPVPPPPMAKGVHVLFAGKEEDVRANWVRYGSDEPAAWKIRDGGHGDGGGDIASKEKFTDYYLHVEFRVPYMPNAHGQKRGNSGVFLDNHYEIQVLDSYGLPDPGTGDCGAVYSQAAPLINACKPPLQWQTYDIIFRAPRYDENHKMVDHARVTVLQNGIVVQNNQEIRGPTDGHEPAPDEDFSRPAPIRLQDHGTKVRYRNIWVLPLPPHGATHY